VSASESGRGGTGIPGPVGRVPPRYRRLMFPVDRLGRGADEPLPLCTLSEMERVVSLVMVVISAGTLSIGLLSKISVCSAFSGRRLLGNSWKRLSLRNRAGWTIWPESVLTKFDCNKHMASVSIAFFQGGVETLTMPSSRPSSVRWLPARRRIVSAVSLLMSSGSCLRLVAHRSWV